MSKRAINEFLTVETSDSECDSGPDKISNIEDGKMIKVGDDTLTIQISHDIFDTKVPLVNGVLYNGNIQNSIMMILSVVLFTLSVSVTMKMNSMVNEKLLSSSGGFLSSTGTRRCSNKTFLIFKENTESPSQLNATVISFGHLLQLRYDIKVYF